MEKTAGMIGSPIDDRATDEYAYKDTENRIKIAELEKQFVKTNDENQQKLIQEQINSLKAETGISGGKRRTKRRRTNKRRNSKRRRMTKRRRR